MEIEPGVKGLALGGTVQTFTPNMVYEKQKLPRQTSRQGGKLTCTLSKK